MGNRLCAALVIALCVAGAGVDAQVSVKQNGASVAVRGHSVGLVLERTGGACSSLKTSPGGEWLGSAMGGMELHVVEQYVQKQSDYGNAKYDVAILKDTPAAGEVELTTLGKTGGYGFCTMKKRVALKAGDPSIAIEQEFYVGSGAVIPKTQGFMFVQSAPGGAELIMPSADKGFVRFDAKHPGAMKVTPAQGWIAVVRGFRGLVYVMPFEDIEYMGARNLPTGIKFVWRTVRQQVDVEAGRVWKIRAIPYAGLADVNGAGALGCGEIVTGEAQVQFFSLAAVSAKLEVAVRKNTQSPWRSIESKAVSLKAGLNSIALAKDPGQDVQVRVRFTSGESSTDLYKTMGDVQLPLPLQGERMEPAPAEVTWRDIDYGDYVEAPHVKWAKPLPGRPIRMFADWGQGGHNRMVNDLMQRIDCRADTVTLATGLEIGWGLGGPIYGQRTKQDITSALKTYLGGDQAYDVIVLGGNIPYKDCIGDEIGGMILDRVRGGAGLVFVGMDSMSKLFKAALPVKRAFGEGREAWSLTDHAYHPITAGLPVNQLRSGITKYIGVKPEAQLLVTAGVDGKGEDATINPLLVTGRYGKGRIVTLSGLPAGEEGKAVLTKAILWAAQREPALRIVSLGTDKPQYRVGETPRLRVACEQSGAQTASYDVRIQCGDWESRGTLSLTDGKGSLTAQLPADLAVGSRRVDVIIGQGGKPHNFGFCKLEILQVGPLKVRLAQPAHEGLRRRVYRHGTQVKGTCTTVGGYRLTVDLEDGLGRVLDRATPTSGGAFSLSTAQSERYEATVTGRLWRNGKVVQETHVPVYVSMKPENLGWDEMELLVYGAFGGTKARLVRDAIDPWCSRLGSDLKSTAGVGVSYGIAHVDTGAWESLLRDYAKTKDPKYLHRVPCINSPSFRETVQVVCRQRMQNTVGVLGTIAYINGDEQSFTSYTREFDFCFAPDCLREFRAYLQHKYGAIERLNAVWRTAYRRFAEANPPLTPDTRKNKKLVPAWNDFRTFNNITFAKGYRMIRDELRKYDKTARLGISGTQSPSVFGGYDWSRLMDSFDMLQEYSMCDELQRAQNPDVRLAPAVGYSMDYNASVSRMWRLLVLGGAGASYYNSASGVYPTFKFAPGLRGCVDAIAEMRESGISKLLMNATRLDDPIAAYYSHESINAGNMLYGGNSFKSMNAWYRSLSVKTSFSPTWRTRRQLLSGKLDVRAMVLVANYALGDQEAGALRTLMDGGGTVIADDKLGLCDLNLREQTADRLASLRKHRRFIPFGQARDMAAASRLLRERLKLTPNSDVSTGTSDTLPTCLVGTYRSGQNLYTGVHNASGEALKLELRESGQRWVYNSRTGKLLGTGGSVSFDVPPHEAAVLARLPYPVTGLELSHAVACETGRELAITAEILSPGSPGTHVVALRVTDPAGTTLLTSKWRAIGDRGVVQTYFFVPHNAVPGDWKIEARDAATGASKQAFFAVRSE